MKRLSHAGIHSSLIATLVLGTTLMLTAAGARAQEHRELHGGGPPRGAVPARSERFDPRYGHNQYYARAGGWVREVPGRPYVASGGRYYYSGGVWYEPRGGAFVVVAAPIGVFVPLLPPFYTTVWFGGVPYYYGNDTYYMWSAEQNGYEVVAPPGDAVAASTEPPPSETPANQDLFIYPQNGQSADSQANDKYECHKWSASQSGFDPTQAGGGVAPDLTAAKRADYQRAMRACLEGRGYSVR